jgi:hypothetical protein
MIGTVTLRDPSVEVGRELEGQAFGRGENCLRGSQDLQEGAST